MTQPLRTAYKYTTSLQATQQKTALFAVNDFLIHLFGKP